ncbi:MAG: glutathione S-transferase N-terminal domain-containing protein [Solirubrobacterales bacterium]
MDATLYSIPGSHPAMAVGRMLDQKGIAYKRRDLMPVVSKGVLKALRFPGTTIPSLRIDGRKITGSREISKALDEIRPEPPLFPADPGKRAAVEEAEVWGEKVLADGVRRILWNVLRRNKAPLRSYAEGSRMGVPIGLAVATAAPILAAETKIHGATDDPVKADLAAFPGWLDRIDEWIADGVLGGDPPNAADFQIAAGLGLAMTLQDLRPAVAARPAGELATRLVPDYPGDAPPILPSEWLKPLRAPAAAA